ncbi:MAG: hypothetical protein ABI604_08995 [Nitrospirota bacterium]
MQDIALSQYVRGLKSPWTVSRVNLDVTGPRLDVGAEHQEGAGRAPDWCRREGSGQEPSLPDAGLRLAEGTVEPIAEGRMPEILDATTRS